MFSSAEPESCGVANRSERLIPKVDFWADVCCVPPMGTVHIVDDDESVRLSLDSLFRSVGLATRLYGTAKDFLTADLEQGPCCLVLDVRLPGQSGLEFQQQLADSGTHIPVVMMTGHGDIPMSVRAMKAGAVDFL